MHGHAELSFLVDKQKTQRTRAQASERGQCGRRGGGARDEDSTVNWYSSPLASQTGPCSPTTFCGLYPSFSTGMR